MRGRFLLHFGMYVMLIAASLPLAFRLVPPNRWYGFRFPGALVSPERWYELNAQGGRLFLAAMLIGALLNVLLFWLRNEQVLKYMGWINGLLIIISLWLVTVELVQALP
ncbi:MAG: SdpI family protein [Candidatus Lambdaproteobacteria bacterium]|nr:SdpI family protein [Candidatus Lambdaproteobacteria bacterium]